MSQIGNQDIHLATLEAQKRTRVLPLPKGMRESADVARVAERKDEGSARGNVEAARLELRRAYGGSWKSKGNEWMDRVVVEEAASGGTEWWRERNGPGRTGECLGRTSADTNCLRRMDRAFGRDTTQWT